MKKIIVIMAVVLMLAVIMDYAYYRVTLQEVTVNVIKTERIVTSEMKGSKYMVYAEEETFENTDCFWAFKFNSSDMHGLLSAPGTYTLKVYGWRVPLFSWHRNIIKVTKVNGIPA